MVISAGTKEFQPTEAQKLAIEKAQQSMAVDAAAGSGKTAVLIRRILKIVGSDWSRLSELLAITFTEKAAGEFRAKLRPFVPAGERFRLDQAWIGTFHSFCARLLRRFGPTIGLDPSFALLDENASGMLMRKCVRETLIALLEDDTHEAANLVEGIGFKTAVGTLEELMGFRWYAKPALRSHEDADKWEKSMLASLETVFEAVKASYLDRLSELGALDFQELEIRALKLLERKSVVDSCRSMFRHILVDEYQDTNDIQTELVLKIFAPSMNRLFIVGDEAQSIYRFRGANVSCFARVRAEIEKRRGETIRLAHNFRSNKSIISFVNLSQEYLADGLFSDPTAPKPMESVKEDGKDEHVIELKVPLGEDMRVTALREREAKAIADTIEERVTSGDWSYGEIVMLFRAMSSTDIYEAALRRRLIPCSSTGGRGFLLRTEIADLMAALRYAANDEDIVSLLTLLRSPIAGLSDDELVLMAGANGHGLKSAIKTDPRLTLINDLPGMSDHMRPSEILRRVMNEAGLELLWAGLDPSGAALSNMDRLITIARDLEREVPTPLSDFTAFMDEMRERGARLGDAPPDNESRAAVRLMTVHAAKGLEFPIVILPDLMRPAPKNNKAWIFSRGDASGGTGIAFRQKNPAQPFGKKLKTARFTRLSEDESIRESMESKRLLYVAMTRAMNSLVIPTHEGIRDKNTWHEWIGQAIGSDIGKDITHALSPAVRKAATAKQNSLENIDSFKPVGSNADATALRLSVSQLDSYSVCPMQYYLKYVLGLPASEVTRYEPNLIEPNIVGSIVHAMLARASRDEKELMSAAKAQCLASGVHASTKNLKEFLMDAKKAIELAGANDLEKGERELPFEIALGRSTISGTIDWLKPVNGGYEIIDYKTGTEKESKLGAKADQYEVQMQAYSLAAESITESEVLATKLVFPAAGKVLTRKVDARRREAAKTTIEAIVAGIEARDYEIKAKPQCESCIFNRNGMCWMTSGVRKRSSKSRK